ncbi:MAG: YeeE/YedE family protein [Celeribacter sp.]|jgi:uncharacterized membrane protein YedE/YeeE
MLTGISEPVLSALIGLGGGLLLGLAARLGRFCTLGAIEDALYGGTSLRLRAWGLAIALSVTGVFTLAAAGLLPLGDVFYLRPGWNPFAHLGGGLVFGYGMALAGTCGYGALARLGGGDLRAMVIVLVMGTAALATLIGPLAPLRVALFPPDLLPTTGATGLAQTAARLTGLPALPLGAGAGLIASALLIRPLLRQPRVALGAVLVAGAVLSGWAGTAWLWQNGFDGIRPQSHTFAAPPGETLLWLMTGGLRPVGFGIGSVVGVVIGACIGCLRQRRFRWEACEDPRELRRQIAGAALMGAGAVVAQGCTIGQGISAASTLSYGAPLTLVGIGAGAALGLRQLIAGFALD